MLSIALNSMVKVANSKDIAQQIDKAIEEQLRII
jgi:hypothetical protein